VGLDDLDDTLGGIVAGSAGSVLGPRILQIRRGDHAWLSRCCAC